MEETETIVSEMRDRFGTLPPEALRLIDAVHLRIAALPCSFAHVSLKAGKLVCEFPSEDHTTFYTNVFPAMMHTVAQMRDVQIIPKGKKVLIQSAVGSLESAILLLKRIVEGTKQVILAEQQAQDSSNQIASTF
jgi:transcription-repair coupling factor (superfamily II helicase)